MAISKQTKHEQVAAFADSLEKAKMTVFAQYQGLSVADMQKLRAMAREAGVSVKVIKNRLVRVALGNHKTYKDADTSNLTGQLVYAMSQDDEVAPAQVFKNFARENAALQFVGAFSGEGKVLASEEVKALADLPSKPQLIAEVVAQLLSPIHDTTNALSGNLHALLDGIEAKASN
jgi:large subunit ribosomal protein L10